jgi:hypothetical protein
MNLKSQVMKKPSNINKILIYRLQYHQKKQIYKTKKLKTYKYWQFKIVFYHLNLFIFFSFLSILVRSLFNSFKNHYAQIYFQHIVLPDEN